MIAIVWKVTVYYYTVKIPCRKGTKAKLFLSKILKRLRDSETERTAEDE